MVTGDFQVFLHLVSVLIIFLHLNVTQAPQIHHVPTKFICPPLPNGPSSCGFHCVEWYDHSTICPSYKEIKASTQTNTYEQMSIE